MTNSNTDQRTTEPSPSLNSRQRAVVVLLLLFALFVSYLVLRFVDPTTSTASKGPAPIWHSPVVARSIPA